MKDRPVHRVSHDSFSGGRLTVSYKIKRLTSADNTECRADITLPHSTTLLALARRLREQADAIERLAQ